MNELISVIIPTLNEEKLLPRLLEKLRYQTYTNFEVVLVDASSKDETVQIASSYKKYFPLTIVNIKEKNISRSRNVGAQKARGKFLLFIDADNFFPITFLSHMKKHIDKGDEMVIPAVRPDFAKPLYYILYSLVNFLVNIANKLNMPFSTGGNFLIKKEIFNTIKGFDETIFVGEDHDLVGKAHRIGVKIAFAKNPKIAFSVRRFEKEGLAVLAKYFISTVYIAFFGKITKKIYNYQMGGDYYSGPKKL